MSWVVAITGTVRGHMYIPTVIKDLEVALANIRQTSPFTIEFGEPDGGYLVVSIGGSDKVELELSGNKHLILPFSAEDIHFLRNSMGWKLDSATSNFRQDFSSDYSVDDILGVVLWSLEFTFHQHIKRVSDRDYWPNFEEAEEMDRRGRGIRHQHKIENLAK
jgi:hypothetical protein